MKKSLKVLFKSYTTNQISLFHLSLEELIPSNHTVRLVNPLVEGIELNPLLATCEGGGTSSCYPRMLKVLIYGYCCGLYSARKIESALTEHIHFMWLGGMQTLDHRTINNFRLLLRDVIEQVFYSQVELLIELGLVNLENIFTDDTKLEANANRYTFVWGKSTDKYQNQVQEKLKNLSDEIEQVKQLLIMRLQKK